MGEERGERGCVGGAHGGQEEGVVFEGLAVVVDEIERREGSEAEPVDEERLHFFGGVGEGGDGVVVGGDGREEVFGEDGGGGCGDEEVGCAEAEACGGEVGCSHAGRVGDGCVDVFADGGEGLGLAAEPNGVGWLAEVLDGEAEANGCGGLLEFGLADELEELCAVAEEGRCGGGGVPEDVAEAAESGEVCGDGVPVGYVGLGGRCSDALEALAGLGDVAGVECG